MVLRLRWAKKIVTMSFCYPDRPAQKIPAGLVPWDWTGCPRIPRNAAGSPCFPAPPGTSPGSPDTSGRRGVPTRSVRRTIRPRMYRYSGSHVENSSLTTGIRSLAACQTVLQHDNSYMYFFERHGNCFFFFSLDELRSMFIKSSKRLKNNHNTKQKFNLTEWLGNTIQIVNTLRII